MFIRKQCFNFAPQFVEGNIKRQVPVKEGENIEKALKKFKRKFEKTGVIKELRSRQAFEKPSVANRKKIMRAIYVQKMQQAED